MPDNRSGFVLKVRPERLAAFRARHQEVRPEMRPAPRCLSVLFIRSDDLLFGYLETSESTAAAQVPMLSFFNLPKGARPDEPMIELESVFYLP